MVTRVILSVHLRVKLAKVYYCYTTVARNAKMLNGFSLYISLFEILSLSPGEFIDDEARNHNDLNCVRLCFYFALLAKEKKDSSEVPHNSLSFLTSPV